MAFLFYRNISNFIINKETIIAKFSTKNKGINNINVNIYLFDGLSRFRFKKQMLYTKDYLNSISNEYKLYEMMKYHTLGTNSPLNYKGLLYGNKSNSLFKIFRENNYSTAAIPGYYDRDLSFCGRSNKKYVDITIQLFRNCSNQYLYGKNIRCLGNKQRHKYQLEMIESLLLYSIMSKTPLFSFSSFMESHDSSFISLTRLDKDFRNHIKKLDYMKVLNKSITILIGDHGMHYGDYYKTFVYQ